MSRVNILMQLSMVLQFFFNFWLMLNWPQWANFTMPVLALLWLSSFIFLMRLQQGRGLEKRQAYAFFGFSLLQIPFGFLGALATLPTLRQQYLKNSQLSEKLIKNFLLLLTLLISLSVVLIIIFILFRGLWSTDFAASWRDWKFFFAHVKLRGFLLSLDWRPISQPAAYGILGFIWGSLYMTFLALFFALPFSLAVAIFIAEIAPRKLARLVSNIVELLAGIPSVLFGFLGIMLVAPAIRHFFPYEKNSGFNVLSGALILVLMILPTITNVAVSSIRSVSNDLRFASHALGATQWLTTLRVVLPKARSGILTGVILGISRAIGETAAVVMVAGNALALAKSPLDPVRSLTMHVIAEMSYAQDDVGMGIFHLTALFTTSLVLLVFILVLNIIANSFLAGKRGEA